MHVWLICDCVAECDLECPRGTRCKVFEPTNETYCEPSCDIDNGGCFTNQTCSLSNVTCQKTPCAAVAQCSGL